MEYCIAFCKFIFSKVLFNSYVALLIFFVQMTYLLMKEMCWSHPLWLYWHLFPSTSFAFVLQNWVLSHSMQLYLQLLHLLGRLFPLWIYSNIFCLLFLIFQYYFLSFHPQSLHVFAGEVSFFHTANCWFSVFCPIHHSVYCLSIGELRPLTIQCYW